MFKGNWKQAVEMIFAEKQGDRCELEKMKACYRDGNFSDAAYHCPRHMNIEKCILEHLSKYQNDFAGALATAPKSSSLMWAHAYQSYIWNKVVTYRIQQYGLNVVEGDLVGNGTSSNGHDVEEDTSTHVVSDSFTRVGTMTEDCITVVTADDVVSNKYSIEDIVIPLPGSSVIMPTNSVAEHYEDLLSADGLSLIYFKDKTPLQYRMKGTYRRIVQGASDLTWSIKAYNEPNENLNTTELKASLYSDFVFALVANIRRLGA